MERRKAITAAAAAALTMLAGAAGIALNSGIVGADGDGKVGNISPVRTTAPPITVVVEDLPQDATITPAPGVVPAASDPLTAPVASGDREDDSDDGYEDDGYEDEVEQEHEDEVEDEYEGAEDDD